MRLLMRFLMILLLIAACAEPGPVISPAGPPVQIDETLNVDGAARIEPGFRVGVWRIEIDGSVRTLTRQMLIGDETAEHVVLALDFADGVSLVDAYKLRLEAAGSSARRTLKVASIVLNNSNADGIISGRVALEDGSSFDFWGDTDPGSVIEPEIDVPFELKPGFVVDGFNFALRYIAVTDDSRCPPDVTCVWEGQVILDFEYVDETQRAVVQTTGIATPDGPAYGASPTIDLFGARYLEILEVTDQSVLVVVRSLEG